VLDIVITGVHLPDVDGDIFGAVTRLGRDAAEGISLAFEGAYWDPFLAARCLDVLHAEAGGVPSLAGVIQELEALCSTPLLAHTLREAAIERIDAVVRHANGTILDLILRSVAERSILRGEYDPVRVLGRYCETLLDRAIISSRGGLLEQAGRARRDEARSRLAPVAATAAEALLARPDSKRLGLAKEHARLQSDTDLLGATE
jgi:hypothetical protein